MKDTDRLPPERKLSPRRRDQILRSVLSGEEPDMMGRRRIRWIAPIVAAAVAALIAVGAVALTGGDQETGGTPPVATTPADTTVPLDLGPLSDAEVEEMLRERFGPDLDGTSFHYTRRIDGPTEPIPVIFATPPGTDEVFFKTGNLVGMMDGPAPTPTHPIENVDPELDSNPESGDAVYRGTSDYWKVVGIYRAADTVDRVEVRVGTPDGPEPWRSSATHGGYAFWATWFDPSEYEPGTELTVEWRAYDTDGDRLDSELLPDQPRTVTVP